MQVSLDSCGTTYNPRRVEERMLLDIDESILLSSLVEPRPSSSISLGYWLFCVGTHMLYMDPRIGTYTAVYDHIAKKPPRQPSWWTSKGVRKAIEKSRETITHRARRRSLIINRDGYVKETKHLNVV